jgi:uncharacterized integral membrane protein
MPIAIPLLLLLLPLLLLIVFLGQNLEPMVSLVFLGIALPKLPIALWILAALGVGLGLSVGFSLILSIAHRRRKAPKAGPVESDAWDDPDWEDSKEESLNPQPPKPKAPDIDAEFRVITPPMRNPEDDL